MQALNSLFCSAFFDQIWFISRIMNLSLLRYNAIYSGKLKLIWWKCIVMELSQKHPSVDWPLQLRAELRCFTSQAWPHPQTHSSLTFPGPASVHWAFFQHWRSQSTLNTQRRNLSSLCTPIINAGYNSLTNSYFLRFTKYCFLDCLYLGEKSKFLYLILGIYILPKYLLLKKEFRSPLNLLK